MFNRIRSWISSSKEIKATTYRDGFQDVGGGALESAFARLKSREVELKQADGRSRQMHIKLNKVSDQLAKHENAAKAFVIRVRQLVNGFKVNELSSNSGGDSIRRYQLAISNNNKIVTNQIKNINDLFVNQAKNLEKEVEKIVAQYGVQNKDYDELVSISDQLLKLAHSITGTVGVIEQDFHKLNLEMRTLFGSRTTITAAAEKRREELEELNLIVFDIITKIHSLMDIAKQKVKKLRRLDIRVAVRYSRKFKQDLNKCADDGHEAVGKTIKVVDNMLTDLGSLRKLLVDAREGVDNQADKIDRAESDFINEEIAIQADLDAETSELGAAQEAYDALGKRLKESSLEAGKIFERINTR